MCLGAVTLPPSEAYLRQGRREGGEDEMLRDSEDSCPFRPSVQTRPHRLLRTGRRGFKGKSAAGGALVALPVWWGHVCLLKSQIQASDTRVASIAERWGCTLRGSGARRVGWGWGWRGRGRERGLGSHGRERAFLAEGLAEQAE